MSMKQQKQTKITVDQRQKIVRTNGECVTENEKKFKENENRVKQTKSQLDRH